jgi:hypothetical protein
VTVRIGIHLNIHGIRRRSAAQVIFWMPYGSFRRHLLPGHPAVHAMLRSDSPRFCSLDFLDARKPLHESWAARLRRVFALAPRAGSLSTTFRAHPFAFLPAKGWKTSTRVLGLDLRPGAFNPKIESLDLHAR